MFENDGTTSTVLPVHPTTDQLFPSIEVKKGRPSEADRKAAAARHDEQRSAYQAVLDENHRLRANATSDGYDLRQMEAGRDLWKRHFDAVDTSRKALQEASASNNESALLSLKILAALAILTREEFTPEMRVNYITNKVTFELTNSFGTFIVVDAQSARPVLDVTPTDESLKPFRFTLDGEGLTPESMMALMGYFSLKLEELPKRTAEVVRNEKPAGLDMPDFNAVLNLLRGNGIDVIDMGEFPGSIGSRF